MVINTPRRCRILFKPDTDKYTTFRLLPDESKNTDIGTAFGNIRKLLHALLQNRRGRSIMFCFRVRFLKVCDSGYVTKPEGRPPMLYTHLQSAFEIFIGNSFCDTAMDYRFGDIHSCRLISFKKKPAPLFSDFLRSNFQAIKNKMLNVNKFLKTQVHLLRVSATTRLMHYYERRWEEWVQKWLVGNPNIANEVKRDKGIGLFNTSMPDADFILTKIVTTASNTPTLVESLNTTIC